jgi:hypothetical protein
MSSLHYIRFFARVAFLCNICFLLAAAMRLVPRLTDTEWGSLVIVLGWLVAIVLNVLLNATLLVLLILRKSLRDIVPVWLIIVNFLFLIAELIFFLQ